MTAEEFKKEIDSIARRALETLSAGGRTAWELKLALKVPHTSLHMALGMLLERGRISLRPEELTYAVEASSSDAPQDAVMTASSERHAGAA